MIRRASFLLAIAMLVGCSDASDDAAIRVAFIDRPEGLRETGLRLSPTGQHIRAATTQGLVRFDQYGQVVPGLAERWIVTDDGASYIFRLTERNWPDGTPVTSRYVKDELTRTLRQLKGTSLGLDLAVVRDVRAMAARVVEIRLVRPMPEFLQLLAQPELGVMRNGESLGPMRLSGDDAGSSDAADDGRQAVLNLSAIPPEERGMPRQPKWQVSTREITVRTAEAREAIAIFGKGQLDAVFNGRLAALPYVDTGPLSRGTIRLDGAIGLFGLDIRNESGFLADPANREAINMAIDRATLLTPFNIEGWQPALRISPFPAAAGLASPAGRWWSSTLEQRQNVARQRVAQWQAAAGSPPRISLELPEGTGSDILFRELRDDLAAVGIDLVRADTTGSADLGLRDRVARFDGQRWYLNQFHCAVSEALCDPAADTLVAEATLEPDQTKRLLLLSQAEALLEERGGYIPLGSPIRWSLLRGNIAGFAENEWAIHSLFSLSGAPL